MILSRSNTTMPTFRRHFSDVPRASGDEPALGLNEALDYLDVAMNMGLLGKA